jgi:hypothetical protein
MGLPLQEVATIGFDEACGIMRISKDDDFLCLNLTAFIPPKPEGVGGAVVAKSEPRMES